MKSEFVTAISLELARERLVSGVAQDFDEALRRRVRDHVVGVRRRAVDERVPVRIVLWETHTDYRLTKRFVFSLSGA